MADLKIIIAPPGAGKTRRLVGNIADTIGAGIVNAYQVVPITFTREGAMEITRRLNGDVTGRTCHSLAYFIINLAAKMRQRKPPHIISDGESIALMKRAIEEIGVNVRPGEALTSHQQIQEVGKDPGSVGLDVRQAIKRYQQILQAEGAVDFSGLLEFATQELEDPNVLEYFHGIHLYVDEFQDTNPRGEWPFVKKLGEVASQFTALGDPRQRIFGFRGADWDKLQSDFPAGFTVETMTVNHRCTPEIVRAGNGLALGDWTPMTAARASLGLPVRHVDAANAEEELDVLATQVARWLNAGVAPSQIAVLVRLHEQNGTIERILRQRGINITLAGNRSSVFEREEARALLGYIKIALDPLREDVLEDIVNFPPAGFGNAHRFRMRSAERLGWNDIMIALSQRTEYPDHVIARIGEIIKVRNAIRNLNIGRETDLAVRAILTASGISEYLVSEGEGSVVRMLEGMATEARTRSIEEFSEYLEQEINRPRVTNGVVLSTLHASKGREWEAVIMPGMLDGLMPHQKGDEIEEQNLAYVGVTRAKNDLLLLSNRSGRMSPYTRVADVHLTRLQGG